MRLAAAIALAGLLALAAQPALAQTLGQGTSSDIPWLRLTGALILCLSLAVAGAYALRTRMGGGAALPPVLARLKLPIAGLTLPEAAPRRLQLVETIRLSHQVDVCLIRCDDRQILVAASPQGVVVLDRPEPS